MATYLVTGVAGFIGSTLARAVLAQGGKVVGFDNFSTGKRENLADIQGRIDLHEADLLDLDALHQACRGVDFVLHEAAIPSVPRSVKDPLGNNRANVDGTLNMLVAARDAKVKRVIYAASSSAYGDTPTLPKREDMPPNPISPYATAKLASEYYMTQLLPLLRSGDGVLALFQCLRTATGSHFALLRGAGEIHYPNAQGRPAYDFWRWKAEPRLHVCRQRSRRQSACLQSGSKGSRWTRVQCGDGAADGFVPDLPDSEEADWVHGRREICRRACGRREALSGGYFARGASIWATSRRSILRKAFAAPSNGTAAANGNQSWQSPESAAAR